MGDTVKISEVIGKLKNNGCYFAAHKTNHDFWYSPISNNYFTVPRHTKIAKKLSLEIYKQAGIKQK